MLLIASNFTLAGSSSAQYSLEKSVFASGGGAAQSALSRLDIAVVAQTGIVGKSSSSGYQLQSGFISALGVSDTDSDGVPDSTDNCPNSANPDQVNTDDDIQGDACDADDDNDGFDDAADNCPIVANANQLDTDSDSLGNACDLDDDGDGIADEIDNCQHDINPNQLDNENDGLGDICDMDDDNDGVGDEQDNCSLHYNPDQLDEDQNGLGAVCETDQGDDICIPIKAANGSIAVICI